MSSQSSRGGTLRGHRRRKTTLNLDLNIVPPGDNRDQEGTSNQVGSRNLPPRPQGNISNPNTVPTIDVEAIDDDVIESSPTAFAAAARNKRRNLGTIVVDVESEEYNVSAGYQKRRRMAHNQNVINGNFYINLESNGNYEKKNPVVRSPPPPPPPKELTFNCPICMSQMVDEVSTKCGHIFCKNCIKAAIKVQAKCPTCRKRVTVKELIRVFLPAASS